MAPKKTNIKIKRSKFNLYNKKKSKAKRALRITISILSICALGVLGYGLGKPLLKYFSERGKTESDSTSALLSSIIDSANAEMTQSSAQSSAPASTSSSAPAPPSLVSTAKIYYLPETAATSEAALSAALGQAKTSGCSIVAITMKNADGLLYYKTAIEELQNTDALFPNALPLQKIVSAISKEGFTPAARINTLMDQLGCYYMNAHYKFAESQGGFTWHDDTTERGGKIWMSPFKEESRIYIGEIVKELTGAGFKHIICANTRFPAFHDIDVSTYLSDLPLKDMNARSEALWSVLDAAEAGAGSGAKLWVEISGKSLAGKTAENTDAELASNKTKLKNVNLVVNYDVTPNDIQGSGGSGTSNTSGAAQSAYSAAKSFAAKAKTALGGAEFAVRVPETVTGKDLEDVKRAMSEAGVAVF